MFNTGGPFSSDAASMVNAFASQIALAVAAVQLADQEKSVKMIRFWNRYNNVQVAKAWNNWYAMWANAKQMQCLPEWGRMGRGGLFLVMLLLPVLHR